MFGDLTFAGGTFADLQLPIVVTDSKTVSGRSKVVAVVNAGSGKGIAVNVDKIEYRINTNVINSESTRGTAINVDRIKYRLTTKVEEINSAETAVNKID